ncbi:MAG: spore maturation protein [Bacilli bacterium]|nr:spore maturation protein [Bacilli bacterium]MDD4809301.1 spore maturation protein [Bacilli bacterium]
MLEIISGLVIPLIVLAVIVYGIKKKVDIYDVFIEGAKESFELVLTIFPYILGMMFAINLFLNTNILFNITTFLKPFFDYINMPVEVLPMALMRPISGNSSLALLNNLLSTYGPDSLIGRIGSVIQGSNDTTLYVLTLYFGSVGVKKIRYALWAGLLSDLCGIIISVIVVNLLF